MYGYDFLCGIFKVPFEIPHKISYPYIERYDFYATLKILWALRFKSLYAFLKRPSGARYRNLRDMGKLDGCLNITKDEHISLEVLDVCTQ